MNAIDNKNNLLCAIQWGRIFTKCEMQKFKSVKP